MSSPPHPTSNKLKPKLKPKMALKPQLAINRAHEATEALDYEEAEVETGGGSAPARRRRMRGQRGQESRRSSDESRGG
jgi:hypothetical protein